jgi:hypothetical protein
MTDDTTQQASDVQATAKSGKKKITYNTTRQKPQCNVVIPLQQ